MITRREFLASAAALALSGLAPMARAEMTSVPLGKLDRFWRYSAARTVSRDRERANGRPKIHDGGRLSVSQTPIPEGGFVCRPTEYRAAFGRLSYTG